MASTHNISQASPFMNTGRSISAMPIVLSYRASLDTIRQFEQDGRIMFSRLPSFEETLKDDLTERSEKGMAAPTYTPPPKDERNPIEVTAEFFQIEKPRQALDFLRHNGDFLPYGDDVSWSDFQKWQRYARAVRDHSALEEVHRALLMSTAERPFDARLDPDGELRSMLEMLTGAEHVRPFFEEQLEPSQAEMADLESRLAIGTEGPKHAKERLTHLAKEIRKGQGNEARLQRAMRQWFRYPPRQNVEIKLVPKTGMISKSDQYLRLPGAMLDYLYSPDQLMPVLHITADCSLQAIAATLYADRIAGVRMVKCEGCQETFEARGSGEAEKRFCSGRCKSRIKVKEFRSKRKGSANGKS